MRTLQSRRAWAARLNRGKARKRMEGPAPEYPAELPGDAVYLRIRVDGLLAGRMREYVCRRGSRRRDRFAVSENGVPTTREIGLVALFDLMRVSLPRVGGDV